MPVVDIEIDAVWDEALPLMRRNWAETGFAFPFDPSREMYRQLQELGLMVAVGAFVEGALVGYATAIVTVHHFNPAVRWCGSDALYVLPEHRAAAFGARLIKAIERRAAQAGASWIAWHTRAGTPLADTMLRHGYTMGDTVVIKEIADGGRCSNRGGRGRGDRGRAEEVRQDPEARGADPATASRGCT